MQNLDINKLKTYGVYAAVILIVIIACILLYKVAQKFLKNELTKAQQDHITKLEINEEEISIPNTEMQNLVAKLKTAFGKYGYATDEDAVYEVFEALNNRSEVLALIKEFGVYEDHTLSEWMNKELNQSELEHVQNILASKGIVYTF